ncbi:unnamed protein product, partial [Meganyctiphanes norvegica]
YNVILLVLLGLFAVLLIMTFAYVAYLKKKNKPGNQQRAGSLHIYDNPDNLPSTVQGNQQRATSLHTYENTDNCPSTVQGYQHRPGLSHVYEDPDKHFYPVQGTNV